MRKMSDFIRAIEGEPTLPFFVRSFAKSAGGGSSKKDDDDDEDDDDDDDDDDDEDDDPDADKTDEELRDELKKTRASLAKANGQSAKRRKALRERERELEEARRPKPKKKADDDDDGPDLDTIRHEAKAEGEKAGTLRAKRAEAKAALLSAGVNPARVVKATGLLDLDELDLDDDGLDGVEEAIEARSQGGGLDEHPGEEGHTEGDGGEGGHQAALVGAEVGEGHAQHRLSSPAP